MELWAAKYRPALAAALETVCDKIEGDLASDLGDRERNRDAFLTQEVDRLKSENEALRKQVDLLEDDQRQLAAQVSRKHAVAQTRRPLGEIAANQLLGEGDPLAKQAMATPSPSNNPPAGRVGLGAAHARLIKKCNRLTASNKLLENRTRHFRDLCDEWVQYALRLEARQAKLGEKLGRPRSRPSHDYPAPAAPAALEAPEAGKLKSVAHAHASSGADALARPLAPAPDDAAVTEDLDSDATQDATQDDSDNAEELPDLPVAPVVGERVQIKTEPSSDGPVIVSERSVGKRKPVEDDSGTTPRPRIKRERISSPIPIAIGNNERHLYSNTTEDSMDLDAGGALVLTPRKRRPADFASTMGTSETGQTESGGGGGGGHVCATTDADHLRTKLPGLADPGVLVWPPTHAGHSPAELDAQVSRPPETRRPMDSPSRRLPGKIASLAEDGSWTDSSSKLDTPTPRAQVPSKLKALLNHGPRGEERVLAKPAARRSIDSPRNSSVQPQPHHHLDAGLQASLRQNRIAKSDARTPLQAARTNVKPLLPSRMSRSIARSAKPTPLRERPLSELRLDDFKINPKLNEGLEYAFDEVVRGRARRTDLLPCVDMNCLQGCGRRFRRLAEGELDGMDSSQKLSGPDGIRLMEEYLGDEAFRLDSMDPQEKRLVWLEARTQEMSDTFGTHRVRATARMRSPPGYWAADFLSTQDTEQDRIEGQKVERRKVEERYKEALRGGGRWLFRDES